MGAVIDRRRGENRGEGRAIAAAAAAKPPPTPPTVRCLSFLPHCDTHMKIRSSNTFSCFRTHTTPVYARGPASLPLLRSLPTALHRSLSVAVVYFPPYPAAAASASSAPPADTSRSSGTGVHAEKAERLLINTRTPTEKRREGAPTRQ